MSRMRIDNREIRNADIFETIIDHFPDIIHSADGEGNLVFANNMAEKLLGYALDDYVTMNVRQLYSDEVLEDLEKGFADLKESGESSVESALKDRDGNRIPVEIRSFGIYDDEGKFIRTFSILRDIRQIKELQASLIHAGRLAAVGELASGIAHDINNPISVIKLSLEACRDDMANLVEGAGDDDRVASVAETFEDIDRAADAVNKLVSHLRSFSRGMAEQKELVDLGQNIDDALFLTKSRVMRHSVKIDNQVPMRRHYTAGGANHIEQVFANLIANACDAMAGRKERQLTIGIESADVDGRAFWEIFVRDTGAGMPPEVRDHVFQSFFTTKPDGEGTGLGLSISRGIVHDHGGEIRVESTEGEGTTFLVRFLKEDPSA